MNLKLPNLKEKKIPAILGVLFLLAAAGIAVWAVGTQQGLFVNAGPTAVPKQVKITNVKEDGFTISWLSDTRVGGFIKYGESEGDLDNTVGDDRDQLTGNTGLYTTHYVTIRGLKPQQKYYFVVGSGSQTYKNESEQTYEVSTAPRISNKPAADVINGKILLASGQPAPGVIVYVELEGAGPMSALTKSTGVWSLALSSAMTADGSQIAVYDPKTAKLTITAQGADIGTSTATTVTANDSPVPDMMLGQVYTFANNLSLSQDVVEETQDELSDSVASDSGVASGSGRGFGDIGGLESAYEATLSVKLINPETPGENVATQSPEILIKGPVGQKFTITVHSALEQKDTLTVDQDGLVGWTPPEDLEPGEHTVTIEYTDDAGVLQKIVRKFYVKAKEPVGQGGLPSFTATPSATVTPTSTPSASPSAKPRSSMPSTASGIPEPGTLTPTVGLLMLGVVLFFAGILWQVRLAKVNRWE